MDGDGIRWTRSSHSGGNSNCVEVARRGDAVAARDSKAPGAGRLTVPADGWRSFVGAIRSGELSA
nr:DUF397 domain-containing protein [Streptomyces aidingensis]